MYDTEKEIIEVIKGKEGELEDLRTRMDADFDFVTLKEYVPKDDSGNTREGYNAYTSSAPKNFFDKVLDGSNRAEASLQIKLPEKATEKERKAASVGELYLFGALNEIDRTMRARGEPPLRQQLNFFIGSRGWVSLIALVYLLKEETVFDVQVWDPLHVTWERGPNGLLWKANKRKATKAQIKAEWDVDIRGKDAILINFFDEERNSVIIENSFAKSPKEHNIDHVPGFVGSVGSMPTMQMKDYSSTMEYRGDSVWASSRGLYEPRNKNISRLMDIQDRAVVGSIKHYSKRGDKAIPSDPYRTWQEIKLSVDDAEELSALELPKAPPETAAIDQILNQDIGQSTLPYPLAYGGTKQAMSGAAFGILAEGTKSVYSPRIELLDQSYIWLCEELLSQFAVKGAKPVDFRGYKPDGDFFTVKAKPKDIDPKWFVHVSFRPKMPRDRESEIMMSLAATGKRGPEDEPLMDYQTAREDILQLRDPDAVKDKILEQKAMSLPPIMITQIAKALKARGAEEDLIRDVLMLLSPQTAQRQPQLPPELLQAAVEALSMNPETQGIAQAIIQVMSAGQQAQQAPEQPAQEEVR